MRKNALIWNLTTLKNRNPAKTAVQPSFQNVVGRCFVPQSVGLGFSGKLIRWSRRRFLVIEMIRAKEGHTGERLRLRILKVRAQCSAYGWSFTDFGRPDANLIPSELAGLFYDPKPRLRWLSRSPNSRLACHATPFRTRLLCGSRLWKDRLTRCTPQNNEAHPVLPECAHSVCAPDSAIPATG